MLSFLKVFLRGLLCTVLLPIIVLVWVLYGVYCLFAFLVTLIRNIILFFAGDNPSEDLPEDIEAKRIIEERNQQPQIDPNQMLSAMFQSTLNQMQQQMATQQTPTQQIQNSENSTIVDVQPQESREQAEAPAIEDNGGEHNE